MWRKTIYKAQDEYWFEYVFTKSHANYMHKSLFSHKFCLLLNELLLCFYISKKKEKKEKEVTS